MATQIDIQETWASSGSVTDPGTTEVQTGWEAEIPTYGDMNYILNKVDNNHLVIAEEGCFTWQNDIDYAKHTKVRGSDGEIYIALNPSGPTSGDSTNPVDDTGNSKWRKWDIAKWCISPFNVIEHKDGTTHISNPIVNFLDSNEDVQGYIGLDVNSGASGSLDIFNGLGTVNNTLAIEASSDASTSKVTTNRVEVAQNTPLNPGELTSKFYVDKHSFPTGTRMVFHQAIAPTGWLQDYSDSCNNRNLVVTTGNGQGVGGNASPISFSTWHSHAVHGHQLSINEIPSHTHNTIATDNDDANSQYNAIQMGQNKGVYLEVATTPTGGGGSHSHGLDWGGPTITPRYTHIIVAIKQV